MKEAIVLGAVVLGFVLLITSAVWGALFPPTNSWTPEKAERMSDVKTRLVELGFAIGRSRGRIHSGPDPASLKSEYDALSKEFQELKSDFENATETPQTISRFLKWSGISLAAVGIIGWYAVKQSG